MTSLIVDWSVLKVSILKHHERITQLRIRIVSYWHVKSYDSSVYPCHKSYAHGIIWSYQDGLILENHPSSTLVRLWLGEALFSTVAQDNFWAITLWLQRGPRVFSSAGAGAGTMKITTYVQGRWNPTGRLPLNNVQNIWRCLGVFFLESWIRYDFRGGDAWILGAVTDPMDSIWFHALVAQDRIEVGKWGANRSNVRALFERRPALVLMFSTVNCYYGC